MTHKGISITILVTFLFVSLTNGVLAGGWGRGPFGGENGKRWHDNLTHPSRQWGQGPFAGKNGARIHDALMEVEKSVIIKPAKFVGKTATYVWNALKRPFVETWKFLSDPFAGARRWYNEKALPDLRDLMYKIVKWLSVGFGASLAFAIVVAMSFTMFFSKPRGRAKRA